MDTTLHVIAICITLALVAYADEQALLWVLGRKARLSAGVVRFLHYAVALGLGAIILTGALLFLPDADYYLADPTFLIKMGAIAALIINTYFIDRFSAIAVTRSFNELSHGQRLALLLSGGVSVLGWLTALACGLLL